LCMDTLEITTIVLLYIDIAIRVDELGMNE
jgi:hypothetical protein